MRWKTFMIRRIRNQPSPCVCFVPYWVDAVIRDKDIDKSVLMDSASLVEKLSTENIIDLCNTDKYISERLMCDTFNIDTLSTILPNTKPGMEILDTINTSLYSDTSTIASMLSSKAMHESYKVEAVANKFIYVSLYRGFGSIINGPRADKDKFKERIYAELWKIGLHIDLKSLLWDNDFNTNLKIQTSALAREV